MRIGSFCLLVALAFGCADDRNATNGRNEGETALTFSMTRASTSVINNTQVYLFDGEGSASGQFRMKIPDVSYEADRLSMSIAAGTWNLALLSADTDINSRIISPIRGHDCASLKMWESTPSGGSLPSMPELRTAFITGQPVVAGTETQVSGTTLLSRNVAMVKVVIVDAGGLDVSGAHRFRLTDVPTTLNWKGGLYPDKDNPTVSPNAMTGSFAISNHPTQSGHQVSDTLRFVIPAHKGTDYLNPSPTDTTTHHLKLSVDLALDGGARFTKNEVVIPRVPRVNGILLVRLMVGGKLEVSTEILDWVDTEVKADLSQTQLFTDKASVGLAYKDTLHVNTNASDYTLDKAPDADWISLRKLDGNAVEVTTNVDTYVDNQPRTSHITLTANNITKKIPVTQRPDRGTIRASEHKLVFCPQSHLTGKLEVTSVGGNWKFITPSPKATANIQTGSKGITPVIFTRTSTTNQNDFDTYYGDGQIVVKNTTTLDTDTVTLVNCFMFMDGNQINAVAPSGGASTAVTNSNDLTVYGGSQKIGFDSWSEWIHGDLRWNSGTQILTMVTDREPEDEAREGFLTFHHAECPDYKITAKVYQDIIVSIPAFDFFVVKFTWNDDDVDIVAEFRGNNVSGDGSNNSAYDKRPVGWNKASQVVYNGEELLKWGGDARGGQGETTFFNAPVFEGDVNSPRKINLDIYATWYTTNRAPDTMTFTMYAYKGGSMVQNGTNFNNVGGETLYDQGHTVMITTTQGHGTYASGGYTRVATVTYDRVKHSASIKIWANVATRAARSASTTVPMRPEEVKPTYPFSTAYTYSDDYTGKRMK